MPFCPKCRYEYEIGIRECPDCGAKLVDRLPDEDAQAPGEHDYKDWIPLANLTSQQMAEMVLESLRAKDIPAVIHSGVGYFGQAGTMGTSLYAPIGGAYTLLVPQEYIEDADAEGRLIM
ncbi:MAG: hypothetical protein PHR28_14385, partial [candidate division Zixibacteria bacterium]|nr:hypothetical protein [candidate division Zixibacteria bacterium]